MEPPRFLRMVSDWFIMFSKLSEKLVSMSEVSFERVLDLMFLTSFKLDSKPWTMFEYILPKLTNGESVVLSVFSGGWLSWGTLSSAFGRSE